MVKKERLGASLGSATHPHRKAKPLTGAAVAPQTQLKHGRDAVYLPLAQL